MKVLEFYDPSRDGKFVACFTDEVAAKEFNQAGFLTEVVIERETFHAPE